MGTDSTVLEAPTDKIITPSSCVQQLCADARAKERKDHIKRPMNAFMELGAVREKKDDFRISRDAQCGDQPSFGEIRPHKVNS